MIKRIYKGSGDARLVYKEFVPSGTHEVKTIRLYAKDLLAEIKLIVVVALFVFGLIFAVPMVRHEAFYIAYWIGTTIFTSRVIYQRWYPRKPKKKSHPRASR